MVVIILLFTSCQDTKTKSSKTLNQPKNNTEQRLEETTIKDEPKTPLEKIADGLDTIQALKQEELIPFYTNYAATRSETRAVISTKFGDIEIELFEDTPLHRGNFLYLTDLKYYNTTYFYRVDKGFVIQAGNSDNKLTNSMRKRIGSFLIPKEFEANHLNDYGAVGAAKFSQQNVSKASSPFEFYIVMDQSGAHHLDNEHTVFGRVVKGMEVAEKIANVKTGDKSEWPVENIDIQVRLIKD